jgi:hypothetical protein
MEGNRSPFEEAVIAGLTTLVAIVLVVGGLAFGAVCLWKLITWAVGL